VLIGPPLLLDSHASLLCRGRAGTIGHYTAVSQDDERRRGDVPR